MKKCYICHEVDDISAWKHPKTDTEYSFCGYCMNTIMGVCAECEAILSRLDPIGVNNDGNRICYKCSAMHDMTDNEQ